MKKALTILCLILAISLINKNNNVSDIVTIPKEAIRFRIIANSNDIADQALKADIKTTIQQEIFPLLKSSENISEARNAINNNIGQVDNILSTYNMPYSVSFGTNFFPEKSFKGVTYDAGSYESLVITLGEGIGDNWWCVLFPPLCLLEAEENETDEVEYKSFVKEMIDKYF